MKRNFVAITLVALFFSIALIGCEKENVNPKSKSVSELAPELQDLYKQMPQRDYGRISVIGDGILKFESIQQYEQVCEQLKQDCEMWEELFYNKYGKMSDEEIMDLEDEIGYDEFLPIKIFEESLDINGNMLFDTQRDAIQQWMDNEFKGENPTDRIFIFEWEQALYNQYREVCIEDTIYQFREDVTVKYPSKRIENWLNIRNQSTIEIMEIEGVIYEDYCPKGVSVQEEKVPFRCFDEGEFNANNLPEVFSGLDYSYWIVVGKVGFWNQDNRLDCKLVNYELHKIKKNGKKVFKKVKRNCCILTTHQIFYRDHLSYSNVLLHTEEVPCNLPNPTPHLQKEATDAAWAWVPIIDLNRPIKYERGVYQNPTLYIKIDGVEPPVTVNLQH